jgi:2-oxoisovalerate ferredoxin oxidoreductase beta subunit
MGIKRTLGMYDNFSRSGKDTRATHYCAGCGHGIIHKLIAEAIVELGIQERSIFVSPIGCSVFGYYYFDVGNIGAAHGRAPCIGTALSRTMDDKVAIVYQGDGDLASIGFNNCFQAASRGERMVTFFVNNAIYGMTGGQMAPTTLLGMKTETSPYGRNAESEGYPLHVSETLNTLKAPVYIERCSVADTKRIMQAKKAIRKALELQRDGKGYAFVEILSPCPTNMGMDSLTSAEWVATELEREFPLGCLRDDSGTAKPLAAKGAHPSVTDYFKSQASEESSSPDTTAPERRYKFSGFGGQGILSLGLVAAEAALVSGRQATWFPSYGPEQRGGSAACSVVISGASIGSPTVDAPDVLICMNQPALDRFLCSVKPGGTLIADAQVEIPADSRKDIKIVSFPATKIASDSGVPKAANTAMLGALHSLDLFGGIKKDDIFKALAASFAKKPQLVPKNQAVFEAALSWFASRGK